MIGWGFSSSTSNDLALGSNSMPGTVAKAKSSSGNCISASGYELSVWNISYSIDYAQKMHHFASVMYLLCNQRRVNKFVLYNYIKCTVNNFLKIDSSSLL